MLKTEINTPVVVTEPVIVDESLRKDGESQADYNARVVPGNQPLQDPITTNYLGQPRA